MTYYLRDDVSSNLLTVSEYAEKFASLVGWSFAYHPDRQPPALQDNLYSPSAHMILIPLDNMGYNSPLPAMLATDCGVLMFELGGTKSGALTAYFTYGRVVGDEVRADAAMRLWFSVYGEPYLAPAPDGDNPFGDWFALRKQGITPAPSLWCDDADYALGFSNANLMLFAEK